MWFKMGLELLSCGFMRELKLPLFRGDNGQNCRIVACIYLLSITACGQADDLQDAADLARLVDATLKQAQIVWDVCIKHGVLRKGPQGYSARAWMIERGILGDFERKHRKAEKAEPQQPQPQQPSKGKLIF